jgi:hypothetical protein
VLVKPYKVYYVPGGTVATTYGEAIFTGKGRCLNKVAYLSEELVAFSADISVYFPMVRADQPSSTLNDPLGLDPILVARGKLLSDCDPDTRPATWRWIDVESRMTDALLEKAYLQAVLLHRADRFNSIAIALGIALGVPVVLLLCGGILGWIGRGFAER